MRGRVGLSKSAGDIILRLFVLGVGEHSVSRASFNEFAFKEKRGEIAHARGLLHVVRDNHDGKSLAQLANQRLNAGGTARIKRGARLVHKQNFWTNRDGARNAKALLLAAGKTKRAVVKAVLHFVPNGGGAQALLHKGV